MPAAEPSASELLLTRRSPLLRRLWVRVCLMLLLVVAISIVTWWLPRRTMVSVWWAGGKVFCSDDRERVIALLSRVDPTRAGWLWNRFRIVQQVFGWFRTDAEITHVHLQDVELDCQLLTRLRRMPGLTWISLHDRHLGPCLNALQHMARLTKVDVTALSQDHLQELLLLRQIEEVSLWSPQSSGLDLDSLRHLANLRTLFLADCQQTDEVLAALPRLPTVTSFTLQGCSNLTDESLEQLRQMPNLLELDVVASGSIGDAGVQQVSKLEHLRTLYLRTPWTKVTEDGLQFLSQMESLSSIVVIGFQCTPQQLANLREALPSCGIVIH